jgi:hypothetical protein
VGGQARKEQGRVGARDIHRVADLVLQVEGFTDVVERHDQHDETAHDVDRRDTLAWRIDWATVHGGVHAVAKPGILPCAALRKPRLWHTRAIFHDETAGC